MIHISYETNENIVSFLYINKIHKIHQKSTLSIYLLKYSFQFQERCFDRNNVLKHVLIGITINSKTPFIPRVKIWWLDLKWNLTYWLCTEIEMKLYLIKNKISLLLLFQYQIDTIWRIMNFIKKNHLHFLISLRD